MALGDPVRVALKLAELRINQWKSREELESIQEERLGLLLAHARKHVPHYRKCLNGIAFEGLGSLQSLPILKKADIRADCPSFISDSCGRDSLRKYRTTGTTGEALEHFMDHSDGMIGAALRQHSFMQCGFSPRDLLANMAYSRMPKFPLQPLLFRVRDVLPSPDIGKNFLALKSASPDVIYAYPSVMALMAEQNMRSGSRLRITKAISVSEILREHARKAIEESFGASIRNYYAASECWAIAWECEKGSLHVNSDNVIVEAVDAQGRLAGAGESGRLLVTPLWRHSMPFIRYEIGDCGTLGAGCRCGRGLHVINSLDGRTSDFILLPSGRRFPWIFVEIPINSSDRLISYHAVQEKDGSLHVIIVPVPGNPSGAEGRVRDGILAALPEKIPVFVEAVGEIPHGTRGKARDFISRIDPSP